MIGDWLEKHRFVTLSFVMAFIFLCIMSFLFMKADEITRDPCSICAEKAGEDVYCILQRGIPITKTYDKNGSVYDNSDEIRRMIKEEYSNQQDNYFNDFNLSDAGLITMP